MKEAHVRRMGGYMTKAMEAAGIPDEVVWSQQGRFYTVEGSGVDVALVLNRTGESWVVREVYDIADLVDGGHKPVVETISMHPVGSEMEVAKAAAMRAVERRIELALDEAS